ncbi:MAG: hypothetical protein WCL44_08860, partial [bacterium]
KFAEDLDEFRIETKARSADWIRARWMNEASNSVFVSYSEAMSTGDGDGDGVPDWWEYMRFGGTNVSDGDYDDDNFPDSDEWAAGTDPTNAASVLRMSIAVTNALSSVLRFDMIPAEGEGYYGRWRRYDLLYSTNLLQQFGGWIDVDGLVDMPAEDRPVIYTNSQSGPAKLYRVRARLEP